MSRTLLFLLIGVVYIVLIAFGLGMVYTVGDAVPVVKAAAVKPDNRISIAHTESFGKLERAQVLFDHKKHEEALRTEGCNACHPVNEDKKLVFDFPREVKGKGKQALMNAYHEACMECHKQKSRENLKSGPVLCAECHKEEYKSAPLVQYPKAEFDFAAHDKHVKKLREKIGKDDCGQCHHSYSFEEKKLVYKEKTEESCSYCHDLNAKRGPEVAAIVKVAAEKGLDMRKASHQQCINCHLDFQKKGDKETGPTECVKCHTGEYKTVAQLEKVARPDRGQKAVSYIDVEGSRMKGVSFNHKGHETYTRDCRTCHHETLKACKECHSLTGKAEGGGVNLADAYHDGSSMHSCVGCHNAAKAEKECAGCHNMLAPMDFSDANPKQETCGRCHDGRKAAVSLPAPLSTAGLNTQKVKKDISIDVLEKEYEPAKFPHLEIIDKLVAISNDSRMARYFHQDMQTLCSGCHHRRAKAAEAQADSPPNCRSCHGIAYDRGKMSSVRLLTAYHNQCVGCHDSMQLETAVSKSFGKGDRCVDCHEKKKSGAPARITEKDNDNVAKQNKKTILNKWRPE
jgi:hypothetical protein